MLRRARPALAAAPLAPLAAPLAPANAAFEAGGDIPDTAWTEWLWRTDPEEPLAAAILLNRNHLLGLLLCRHQAVSQVRAAAAGLVDDDRMTLMRKHPHDMTLRELRDTVDNVLIEWPRFLGRLRDNPRGDENLKAVGALVDASFARLGSLASHPAGPEVFDDGNATEPDDADSTRLRLTRPCLRRLLGTFLVMYRHLHLLALAEPIEPEPFDCQIRRHHMEASGDDFNMLCMSMTLPVAARLNYKQDFPGMYNHVSQVKPPKKDWLAGIRTRDLGLFLIKAALWPLSYEPGRGRATPPHVG